jgi:IS605 OrfB family transposase
MNQLSAELAPQESTSLSKVSFWLRIATLSRGSWVSLPVRHNPYADNIDGTLKKTFSFKKRHGFWYVSLVKELDIAEVRTTGDDVALDLGLRNRLATSNGVIYQVGFLTELEKWDAKYIKIVQGLQNAGIRRLKVCDKFRRFMRKFRSFLKSALLNSVNKVLTTAWQTVVIERLTFFNAEGKLSRKFNRLVRQMGYGIIKEGLAQKAQIQGFSLANVNPAYSSQTCKCGFISHLNRNKDSFRCRSCGSSAHADVNASRILLERFKQSTPVKIHYKEVRLMGLDMWARSIVAQLKASPASNLQGVIGNARAGLVTLDNKEDKAIFALSSINQLDRQLKLISKANH